LGKPLEFNDCALDTIRNLLYVSGVEDVSGKVMAVNITNGDTVWTRTYADPDTMLNLSCHLDASGDYLYAAGNEQFSHDSSRCMTIKYDVVSGDTVWSKCITTDNACNISVFCCEVDQNNDLYLSGWASDSLNHMTVIKLGTGPTGVKGNPIDNSKISKPRLGHSFPNPFHGKISINYQLASSGYFKLAVYNVAGQMVRLLDEGFREAGSYNINWDGRNQKGEMAVNGAYLLRLCSNEQNALGKIILIR
ncbi:MAG: FlgD immunoglobulin-like domain containing protein, partial [Planctomycetota bacterium]